MSKPERRSVELEGLLVDADEGEVDRRLRAALHGKVVVDRGTGRIIARPALLSLPQGQRLLVLLLARHAVLRLGLGDGEVEVDPESLASESQVNLKTCRELLSKLKAKGLVTKGDRGYKVPEWNILLVAQDLTGPEV